MNPAGKLSQLQKRILTCVADALPESGADRTVSSYEVRLRVWGGEDRVRDPAERAAFSRALARLEGRGLLRRERWFWDGWGDRPRVKRPTRRACRLSLTEAGADVAKRLTT